MAVSDIGYIIFVEFLRMTQYPGSPFTGEIIRDLVMFFFIPTVFIIIVIYMLLGRILSPAHVKLRILLGVAVYLFIIFGGYYPVFAYLAGPYFIFLIFIMGILYYFLEHFTRRGGGRPLHATGGGSPYRGASYESSPHFETMSRHDLHEQRDRIIARLADVEHEIKHSEGEDREKLKLRKLNLKDELREVDDQLKIIKKPKFRY